MCDQDGMGVRDLLHSAKRKHAVRIRNYKVHQGISQAASLDEARHVVLIMLFKGGHALTVDRN